MFVIVTANVAIYMVEKEDPVKMHKSGNTLYEIGKYDEAKDIFLRASELYKKANNFFDATYTLFKAGECAFMLKDYLSAAEYFNKSAELSLQKGFDRFGISALEYAKDCYKALDKKEELDEVEKKIKELKAKLEETF